MGRGRVRIVFAVVVAAVTVSVWTSVAHADPEPPQPAEPAQPAQPAPEPAPLDPRAAPLAIDLNRTSRQLTEVDRRLAITREQLAEAQTIVNSTDGLIAENQSRVTKRTNTRVDASTSGNSKRVAELLKFQQSLQLARDMRAATRDRIATDESNLAQLSANLKATMDQQEAMLDQWGAVPVMGDAWLTAPQLAAWYRSMNGQPKLAPGTTIDDLARFYI